MCIYFIILRKKNPKATYLMVLFIVKVFRRDNSAMFQQNPPEKFTPMIIKREIEVSKEQGINTELETLITVLRN